LALAGPDLTLFVAIVDYVSLLIIMCRDPALCVAMTIYVTR
jgi:hypothetical protein